MREALAFEVDEVDFYLVPFVFEASEFLEVGFLGGLVGDVVVVVEGVFGFLDRLVNSGDFGSVSKCFGGVLSLASQSDQGGFDLVDVGGSGGYDVGLGLEEFDRFLILGFPSLHAGLVLVFGWGDLDGSGDSDSGFDEVVV